jgi:hypothetical protein
LPDWEHDQAVVKSEIKKGTKLGKLIIDHFLAFVLATKDS